MSNSEDNESHIIDQKGNFVQDDHDLVVATAFYYDTKRKRHRSLGSTSIQLITDNTKSSSLSIVLRKCKDSRVVTKAKMTKDGFEVDENRYISFVDDENRHWSLHLRSDQELYELLINVTRLRIPQDNNWKIIVQEVYQGSKPFLERGKGFRSTIRLTKWPYKKADQKYKHNHGTEEKCSVEDSDPCIEGLGKGGVRILALNKCNVPNWMSDKIDDVLVKLEVEELEDSEMRLDELLVHETRAQTAEIRLMMIEMENKLDKLFAQRTCEKETKWTKQRELEEKVNELETENALLIENLHEAKELIRARQCKEKSRLNANTERVLSRCLKKLKTEFEGDKVYSRQDALQVVEKVVSQLRTKINKGGEQSQKLKANEELSESSEAESTSLQVTETE